jgi:putative ABC transport system permease protein
MESVLNDVKHGLRVLLRNPGFAVVVILALALGIGANTAVFTVLNAVLFKPLPYPDADRIVSIAMRFTGIGIPDDRNAVSPPEFQDLRRLASAFTHISAVQNASYNIRFGSTPERIAGATVSANFFRTLGVEAQLGRTFIDDEEQTGRDTSVLLGHGLWQRRFGADPGVIGRSIEINGRAYVVVGVAPPDFNYPNQSEMWTPLAFTEAQLAPNSRGNHGWGALARIKPDLSLQQALADMERVSRLMIEGAPQYPYENFNFAVLIRPLLEDFVGTIRPTLLVLMGAVGLVLLIACANVANLLMVRASARQREIGIRTALGASRARLLRQLLTESILLALVGAAFGLLIARFGVATITSMGGTAFPRLAQAGLDWPTMMFTILVAVATGLFFGVVPALQVSQSATQDSLREGGRSSTAGGHHQHVRRLLVVAEVALSLALLSGAGLLIKSFMRLLEVDPGFKSEGILTMRVVLPQARYSQPEQMRNFFRELMDRVSTIPGVQSVGAINALPLSGTGGSGTTTLEAASVATDQASPEADWRVVTTGYFETIGTQLVAGRYFEARDNESAAPVAIIDESMARTYWPNDDPIGKRLKRGGPQSPNPWMTVVGVVRHVRYQSLERPSRVQLYWPHAQTPATGMSLAVRTSVEPGSIASAVQRAAAGLDPDQPVYAIRTMDELLGESMLRRRLVMILLVISQLWLSRWRQWGFTV